MNKGELNKQFTELINNPTKENKLLLKEIFEMLLAQYNNHGLTEEEEQELNEIANEINN